MFWAAIAGVALGPVGWAVAGVATGVAIAAAMSDEEEAEKRGEQRATAKYAVELEKSRDRVKNIESYLKENLSDWQKFGEQLIAMSAVGFACANCDGEIHPKEIDQIDEFVAGINNSDLPPYVKKQLNKFQREPPNLKTAFELAKKAKVKPSILDDVIKLVMHADSIVHANEKAFMIAWRKMKHGTKKKRNTKVA